MASNNSELRKPKFPHFFKICLQETLAQGRVLIPKKFARSHGDDLGEKVILQVPSGSVWKVELAKYDDGLWLQNGWREFEEYYSLARGSFLIFEYRSKSFFHVFILDTSATEIDYPYDDDHDDDGEEPMFEKEYKDLKTEKEVDDSASLEILDDCLRASNKRKKSPLPCPQPQKVARKTKRGNRRVCREEKDNKIGKNTEVLRDDEKAKAFRTANAANNFKNLRRNTSRSLEKAAGFESKQPSFVVVMKPAYVLGAFLNIPFKFATNYLHHNNVTLQISERKTWTVGCLIYSDHKIAHLSSGWSAFVKDNYLEPGAKCVFELINGAEFVLSVAIFQAGKEKITRLPELTEKFHCTNTTRSTADLCEGRAEQRLSGHNREFSNKNVRAKLTADEKANALFRAIASFQSANPSVTLLMQPSYIQKRLDIPFPLAKRHFRDDCEIVLRKLDGRTWRVRCRINNDRRQAYFLSRWIDFARYNNLKVGDICVFDLIKTAELELKVTIIRGLYSHTSVGPIRITRANVVERNTSINTNRVRTMCSSDRNFAGRNFPGRSSCSWMPKAAEAAEKFTSMHPYFKATMKSYNLHISVNVPRKFMELLKQEADNVTLVVGNGGKRWVVKLIMYPKRSIWKLSLGWSVFSRENSLEVGDICAFELIDRESSLLRVSIFKRCR